ncbi:hypothetical protein [Paenibacillus eucommiae]|uniref:DUF4325 domain-containing protein n=1 Tax=Paenibacillus eucommiae TaxID=1355755 RepID=A0ABS4JC95_9BACL|nr:hypothetical protein [Paenibacillus eucommiae]MBP1996359.1 hypothetical protein [Paenibacillus eucommiae]
MSAPSDYFPALLQQFSANTRFEVKNPALLQPLLWVQSKAAERRVLIDFSGSLSYAELIDSLIFIVKVADPLGCERWRDRSSVPAAWPAGQAAGKSPPIQRKTLAGSPFERGVRAIRANVANEREWLWVEERKRPPLKICSHLCIHPFNVTNL